MDNNIDARVLILDDDDKILLVLERGGQKIIPGKESFEKPSKWGLPGGRGEAGDKDGVETAMREVKEETGLPVYINDQLKTERLEEGYAKIVFLGYPAVSKIKINRKEILDCKWFPRGVLYDENFDMYFTHRQMAQELLRKLGATKKGGKGNGYEFERCP